MPARPSGGMALANLSQEPPAPLTRTDSECEPEGNAHRILASQYPLPTETFVYESVRWLGTAGHRVEVIADRRGGGPGLAEADYPAAVLGPWMDRGDKLRRMLSRSGAGRRRRLAGAGPGRHQRLRSPNAWRAPPSGSGAATSCSRTSAPPERSGCRSSRRPVGLTPSTFTGSMRPWHLQERPHAYDGLIASRTAARTTAST